MNHNVKPFLRPFKVIDIFYLSLKSEWENTSLVVACKTGFRPRVSRIQILKMKKKKNCGNKSINDYL